VLFIVIGTDGGPGTENPSYLQLARLSFKHFYIAQCNFISSRFFHVTLILFYVGELLIMITCQILLI